MKSPVYCNIYATNLKIEDCSLILNLSFLNDEAIKHKNFSILRLNGIRCVWEPENLAKGL